MTTSLHICGIATRLLAALILFAVYAPPAAAAVPAVPANPVATAALESQISLTWTTSSGATSYSIYRGASSGNETLLQSNVPGNTFEDTGLVNGKTFYYKVTAVNAKGESGKSSEVSAVTKAAPPANFSATAGDSQIVLKWSASATATEYRVYRDTLGGIGGAASFLVTGTGFTDTGLINGTTYYYEIAAINASGENSAGSGTTQATPVAGSSTEAPAGPPVNVTATAGNGKIILNWFPVSNASSYRVFRGLTGTALTWIATVTAGTTYTDSSPTNGTSYFYSIHAVNSGVQTSSGVVTATPYLPAPVTLTATGGIGQNVLTWPAVSGACYAVYRGVVSKSETLLDSGLTANTFTDAGLAKGGTYYYRVVVLNPGGSSARSNEVSATASAPAPVPWSGTITFSLPGEPVQSCRASIPDLSRPVQAAFLSAEGPNMQAVANKYNAINLDLDGFTAYNFGTPAAPINASTLDDSHTVNVIDYRWPLLSAQRIQAVLTAAAQQVPSSHTEIQYTNVVLYGFSEGTDNINLALAPSYNVQTGAFVASPMANRVLAVVNLSELDEDHYNPLATMDTVPHLFLASGLVSDGDSALTVDLEDFPSSVTHDVCARGLATNQGAPLTVIDNVGVGHGGNPDHPFISIWLDSILSQRLPATPPNSTTGSLPNWQYSPSWTGAYSLTTTTSAPWGSSGNPGVQLTNDAVSSLFSYTDPRPFTWLPSQNTAQTWQNYAVTGNMAAFNPVITSPTTALATVGSLFNYQITALNDPTSFKATNLPDWLSFDPTTGILSGTPTAAGSRTISLSATNANGTGTGSLLITINGAAQVLTFAEWEAANGLAGGLPGDTPQNDGVPNMLKFLCGVDPTQPISASDRLLLPTSGYDTTSKPGTVYLTLTFRQSLLISGVSFHLQASSDLLNWQAITPDIDQQSGSDANSTTWEMGIAVNGSSQQFIRLQITQP